LPDLVGVWGPQTAQHAVEITGFERSRVRVVGSPSLDQYFGYREDSPSPFPFRYALFAGCYAPFDESAAVRALDEVIESEHLDLKVVYRPHPHRAPRRRRDYVDPADFRHVVLDPHVRDSYHRTMAATGKEDRDAVQYPPLHTYPPLLDHAALVVCPLSTMMLEAAIMRRPVLAIAYHDGIHPDSPAAAAYYDHFVGLDSVPGVSFVRSVTALQRGFATLARQANGVQAPDPKDLQFWIHHDAQSYASRLRVLVEELTR
jgi:hypothetical protein